MSTAAVHAILAAYPALVPGFRIYPDGSIRFPSGFLIRPLATAQPERSKREGAQR